MRVMTALLLGLYLALPARAADSSGPVLLLPGLSGLAAEAAPGYRCADFLAEAGLKPEGLEYLYCRPATEPRTGRRTLTARYRVPGPQAAAVEKALRERTGMAALRRQAGIWQLPESGEGRFLLRQGAGKGSPGGTLAGTLLSVEGLRDGLSGAGTAGSPAVVPSASAGDGEAVPLASCSPEAGPSCTVSMGEVPQQGIFAPHREDWGKIVWFAVTVRLAVE